MCQHFRRINEDGVSSGRALVRDSVFIQFLCQVFHLFDTCFEVVEFGVFVQSDGEGVHIPSIHASVGKIAFVLYTEAFCTFIPVCTPRGNKSAHIDDSVFLGAHCHAIGKREHFPCDFFDSFVSVTFFAHFDEVGILGKTCRVEKYGFAIFVGDGTYFVQVLHRDGLSSGCIVGDGDDDKRNPFSVFCEGFL